MSSRQGVGGGEGPEALRACRRGRRRLPTAHRPPPAAKFYLCARPRPARCPRLHVPWRPARGSARPAQGPRAAAAAAARAAARPGSRPYLAASRLASEAPRVGSWSDVGFWCG